ncbi:MAG: MarR family transcriptional regulator [Catenulispora sp.]|nr:MarR family transcriptional regulator [Catenulispora sp.]
MSSVSSGVRAGGSDARRRRRLTNEIKENLRELSVQLSLLNHHVGVRAELKDVDLDCLDLIVRHGPLSPSALARRAGLHPATMTGILDRLQKGGWIVRERDPDGPDRRAVSLRALKDRNGELFELFAGMNAAMDELFTGYTDEQLATIQDFVRRTTDAGHHATKALATE